MNFDDVVDELYGLLPAEFTATRDARAAEARAAGERDTAAAIKQLRRPTAGAFLANVLVRERGEEIDALVELGAAMRRAQAEGEGGELRRLSQERRQAIARLAKDAGHLAAERGQEAAAGAVQELADTLEATVADTAAAAAVRSGRLTTALRFSGFGAVDLSGVLAAPPVASASQSRAATKAAAPAPREWRVASKAPVSKASTRRAAPESDRRRRQLEEAVRAVREAEDAFKQATDEADRLRKRLTAAREREESCRAERRALERRLRELREAEEATDRELREARSSAETADRARRTARGRLERAEAARERLEG